MILGIHQSFDGFCTALDEMTSYGLNTFQVFSRNNRNLAMRRFSQSDFDAFNAKLDTTACDTFVIHAPYVINPASPEKDKHDNAVRIIKEDLVLLNHLAGNIRYVLHPGSSMGYDMWKATERLISVLNEVDDYTGKIKICVETMAGQGTQILSDLTYIAYFLSQIADRPNVRLTVDMCHCWAAGIAIDKLIAMCKLYGDKDLLGVIHVNNSKNFWQSRVDRHENLYVGRIPTDQVNEQLHMLYDFNPDIPFILETPAAFQLRDAYAVKREFGL